MDRCGECGHRLPPACVDCGTRKKQADSVRCRSCFNASRVRPACVDCGGRLYWMYAVRCGKCRQAFLRLSRFDVSPLIEQFGSQTAAARALGVNRKTLHRAVKGGASEGMADRLCSRVGWHLSQLPTFNKVDV